MRIKLSTLMSLLCSALALSASAFAIAGTERSDFEISVLCFKGTSDEAERVDVYSRIAFQSLQFVKSGPRYGARYTLHTTIREEQGDKLIDSVEHRQIIEAKYNVTRGATAKSDISQMVFSLEPGEYTIDVMVNDELSGREYRASRRLRVPSLSAAPLSMSSLMLVSSIEQKQDRYVITPFVCDNVSLMENGFFVFFETYTNERLRDSVDVVCELFDGSKRVYPGERQHLDVRLARTQHYFKIRLPDDLAAGIYTLRATALDKRVSDSYSEIDILARSERPVQVEHSVSGLVLNDIDKSIRQLRYVTTQQEIDSLSAFALQSERRQAFEAFWKRLDPSPGTLRNEAFEEYYARIDYANTNFHSYNDGWLTDMGMIYVVLGMPSSIERRTNNADGRSYIVWTYAQSGRRFLFIDYSSFGDFRLSTSTPFSAVEKFRYSPL